MLIIEGKTFDKKYREFFSKLSKENRSVAAYYDMFAILESATKKNQNEDIKIWQKKYKDNIPKWCFKDLKEWAKKLPYESQKRVLSYIKIFEINVC
jgi:DNA-binding transcriptional regulator YbjK